MLSSWPCMIHNMRRAFIACIFLAFSIAACGAVKITIDHNTGDAATAQFKFKRVPSPARNNAAAKAKLKLVVGQLAPNGGGLKALTDGLLPEEEDQPTQIFFSTT